MANQVHPTAIIDDTVELGLNNVIGPYAVLTGRTTIGDDNWIGPHVVIGSPAEHLSYHAPGKPPLAVTGKVAIGSRCIIHEHVAIQSPTVADTVVGDEVLLTHGVHVGHDDVVLDGVTISANAALAGHVWIGSRATLGMGVVVHQHVNVGPIAMVGMGSAVHKDVRPFALVTGFPARFSHANSIGIERAGMALGAWTDEISKPFAVWDLSGFPTASLPFVEQYRDRLAAST